MTMQALELINRHLQDILLVLEATMAFSACALCHQAPSWRLELVSVLEPSWTLSLGFLASTESEEQREISCAAESFRQHRVDSSMPAEMTRP